MTEASMVLTERPMGCPPRREPHYGDRHRRRYGRGADRHTAPVVMLSIEMSRSAGSRFV
jgi:hypothetical protein